MIIKADIITQPSSGQYKERIYDIPSTWNSHDWTWVKFLNEDNMDSIKFICWANNKLLITCDEFLNCSNHMGLELDDKTFELTIKRSNKSEKY